jgi:hypothetical protein
MHRWTLLFAALTAALCVALLGVLRENRHLRDEVRSLVREKARAAGFEPGHALAPVALRDAAGNDVRVDFANEFLGTVFLIHAAGCGACARTGLSWRGAVETAARPDVRVVCVQTDGIAEPLALEGLPASLAVPLPPEGWLADLPAVPATLVVDENGVLTRAWFEELDETAARELTDAIAGLGATEPRSAAR